MNEIIAKLHDQALVLESNGDYVAGELDPVKFAELIVKECMEVASPNYMSTPEDSAYYVERAIDRIADHFGVAIPEDEE